MELNAKLGAKINPENPDSPTVSEVLINKTEDSDMCVGGVLFPDDAAPIRIAKIVYEGDDDTDYVVIGVAEDGRWFVYDFGVATYNTPHELAAALWHNGESGIMWSEVLLEMGWLRLNSEVIERAQREAFPAHRREVKSAQATDGM